MQASPSKTTYVDWTLSEWLYNLENRYHEEIKFGLTRIKQVAAKLNLLSPAATVIMVAGTNGKGTTVAALESIYHAAGYRVGTYSSPHLLSFNERIKVNKSLIQDEHLCQAFCTIEASRENIDLTYFETATLAALLHFQNHQVDVIILEIGMGGRLDATNIIEPDLSIITTIDFDHQEFLGNTLDQIAFEKLGILRVGKPFIYADQTPPQVIRLGASYLNCPTYINGQEFSYQCDENEFMFNCGDKTLVLPRLPWHPNAIAAALMASLCLQELLPLNRYSKALLPSSLTEYEVILAGLQSIILCGRQQSVVTKTGVIILLDVSHNAQSAMYLATTLRHYQSHKRQIHAVFSALCDKDIAALLQPMVGLVDQWYPALLTGKRAASESLLRTFLLKYGIIAETFYESPLSAYRAAFQKVSSGDLIVVYGSFLTVGEVLAALDKKDFLVLRGSEDEIGY